MDPKIARLVRDFQRIPAESQDRFLATAFDLLPPARQHRLFEKALILDDDDEPRTSVGASTSPSTATPSTTIHMEALNATAVPRAQMRSILDDVLSALSSVPNTNVTIPTSLLASLKDDTPAQPSRPVYAMDIEYIKQLDGKRDFIHSVAIARAVNGSCHFFVARPPKGIQMRSDQFLTPSLRHPSVLVAHKPMDFNSLRSTVLSLLGNAQVIMWDAAKDITALELPSSVNVVDISKHFPRDPQGLNSCSLRGLYFHDYGTDIFSNGRDPRRSAKAILRIFHEKVPLLLSLPGPRYWDHIPSNSAMNAYQSNGDIADKNARGRKPA